MTFLRISCKLSRVGGGSVFHKPSPLVGVLFPPLTILVHSSTYSCIVTAYQILNNSVEQGHAGQ